MYTVNGIDSLEILIRKRIVGVIDRLKDNNNSIYKLHWQLIEIEILYYVINERNICTVACNAIQYCFYTYYTVPLTIVFICCLNYEVFWL